MNESTHDKRLGNKDLILIIAGILLLIFAYLFILNDRYYVIGNGGVVFDKWNKQLLEVNDNGRYSPYK